MQERNPASAATAAPGLAVSVHNLRRTYAASRGTAERVALDSISLDIPVGQHVALLGPNGSGKSTLLRILATLDRADASPATFIRILGLDPSPGNLRAIRSRLGVVFQSPGLDAIMTVRENLLAQASLVGLTGAAARERVEEAAEGLGLADRLGDRVQSLSGGLARRADLARALLHRPELLLLDEPTTGLDPRARAEFLATVQAAAGEAGRRPGGGGGAMTVLTSTHLMDEAERAERGVFLHEGRIVADAAPAALREQLGGCIVRCHTASTPALDARARVILAGARLELTTDPAGTLIARAADRGDPALQEALVQLVRAEIPFEVGPPTLGDAFLTLTGSALDAPGAAPPTTTRRRSRRRSSTSHP